MNDKFSIDDILAEYKDGEKKSKPSENVQPSASKDDNGNRISPTMILRSLEKKSADSSASPESTQEMPKESLRHLKGEIKERNKPKKDAQPSPAEPQNTKAGEDDSFKPSEPLFSAEQLRRIADERKQSFRTQDEREKQREKFARDASEIQRAAERIRTENAEKRTASGALAEKTAPAAKRQNNTASAKKRTESARPAAASDKSATEARKTAAASPIISVKTDGLRSFKEKIIQHRFLFEELTKRDFKKKYKRTFLGMLWSVISPFLTFLIQFFVFGSIYRRNDPGFIMYLLTGNLMFHFFTAATNAGMFSFYSNAGVLSKIKVPKTVFLLSSNVAAIFNFLLTLAVYFIFMIFCGVSFGPHLLLMIYPIVCMTIFNIGVSYILASMFVFFRDMQYLYSILTTLISYMSAIFYYADNFPDNLQFVFVINPIYRYIAYMRQLVIDSIVPDVTSHILCIGYAVGALVIGYCFYKRSEKKFVYYY